MTTIMVLSIFLLNYIILGKLNDSDMPSVWNSNVYLRCEERFEDHLSSCVYNAYLAGANLWVSNTDFAVRTGQEPADTLYTPQVRNMKTCICKKIIN